MAAAQADNTQYVQDERVAGLADSFGQFLSDFSPENWMPEPSQGTQGSQDGGAAPRSFMARRVEEMCQSGETVLYIEFDHLQEYSYDMSHQIRDHYERAEPVLRRALQDHVRRRHADYLKEAHGVEKEFFIGVTGLPDTERLRDLRVEKIGRLVSFSGTVTRTTEVRPELFLGAFKCGKCSTRVTGVEQQYKYTTPMICKGKACGNRCVPGDAAPPPQQLLAPAAWDHCLLQLHSRAHWCPLVSRRRIQRGFCDSFRRNQNDWRFWQASRHRNAPHARPATVLPASNRNRPPPPPRSCTHANGP
jgi:DNA replication licensing factor MCM6